MSRSTQCKYIVYCSSKHVQHSMVAGCVHTHMPRTWAALRGPQMNSLSLSVRARKSWLHFFYQWTRTESALCLFASSSLRGRAKLISRFCCCCRVQSRAPLIGSARHVFLYTLPAFCATTSHELLTFCRDLLPACHTHTFCARARQ